MSIYIPGMEMPKEGKRALWVLIHPDGTVEYNTVDYGWQILRQSAVSVPDHGRLIDADEVSKAANLAIDLCSVCKDTVQGDYKDCGMNYCPNCGAKMQGGDT